MEPRGLTMVGLVLGLAAGGITARAGLDAWGETPNRVGFNVRGLFNVKANFSELGGLPADASIGSGTRGENRDYDDGYHRVDSSGNAGGMTWYWGYDRPGQADGAGILMSSTSALPTGRLSEVTDDPHWGGELFYWRELGWSSSYSWGLVAGVGWQQLRFSQTSSFQTDAQRTIDSYSLMGQPPPPAPYRGTFDGADGPRLSEVPSRQTSVIAQGATTRGEYEFEASVYTLRLGLLFETPFADWLDLQFGGGVLGSVMDGEFNLVEDTTVTGPSPERTWHSDRSTGFVGGGYAEINLSARVARGVYVYTGAQYQFLSNYTQEAAGRKVELEYRSGLAAVVGMSFAF